MKAVANWALARLEEPSTYAGIATLVATMTFLPNASQDAQLVTVVGASIAGALAVILPEKKV